MSISVFASCTLQIRMALSVLGGRWQKFPLLLKTEWAPHDGFMQEEPGDAWPSWRVTKMLWLCRGHFCWLVCALSPPQIRIGSNSLVRQSRCRLPEVQEGAGTCQYISTAAKNSGSSGRNSKEFCWWLQRSLQSMLFRQPRTRARQLKTLSASGYVPILALPSCPDNHHSSRSEGGKILPLKPKADKLGFPAHTPLTSFYRLLFSRMQK